jgi:hypothetical protein
MAKLNIFMFDKYFDISKFIYKYSKLLKRIIDKVLAIYLIKFTN